MLGGVRSGLCLLVAYHLAGTKLLDQDRLS
jgi:hypothetical protein